MNEMWEYAGEKIILRSITEPGCAKFVGEGCIGFGHVKKERNRASYISYAR
jgi:hypothetical protein